MGGWRAGGASPPPPIHCPSRVFAACEECESDWKKHGKWHFDLWMGPDVVTPGPNLIACENGLTATRTVEVNASAGHPVDTTPLFNGSSLQCILPVAPCHDVGTTCGNECEIPNAASCAQLAKLFGLSLQRFQALNPKLPCDGTVPAGTSVCEGGTCGD